MKSGYQGPWADPVGRPWLLGSEAMGRTHGFFFLAEEMVKSEVTGIRQRFKRARIGLKDALAVIDMTLDDQLRDLITTSPDAIFEVLNRLIDRTAHGTRIERSRPKKATSHFTPSRSTPNEGKSLAISI